MTVDTTGNGIVANLPSDVPSADQYRTIGQATTSQCTQVRGGQEGIE